MAGLCALPAGRYPVVRFLDCRPPCIAAAPTVAVSFVVAGAGIAQRPMRSARIGQVEAVEAGRAGATLFCRC